MSAPTTTNPARQARIRTTRPVPPVAGDTVAASCGCTGRVRETRGGLWPTVSVLVQQPCPAGHPGRIAAGVTERFAPEQVQVVTPG